ncbi:hypothetical protein lacNasYZ03_09540 [Lactobacillus nasalidis]|uniref:Transposase n=1 Tax=Lactobacillus nasalidis TaxID=2797258 RepID=A0ABQ3WAM6_9LACO|nr:hypothetical protein [Lactobacillus nasalidis]GHV97635.1 hypothetical protein lacNasYZ01_08170 [Lactobacillus nasalidis]GHV99506.1 hypothetical protein lacNasYZ02_09360 [Lactobacillus nasalidis]GHW01267.1 hypothetical protein lacNasYZ03_09540 [Lactobacillus nasalidis]
MLLQDFLQLLTGLNGQNQLYLKVDQNLRPLSKFILAREDCQLCCGSRPLTVDKFRRLTGKGDAAIPLSFCWQDRTLPVYGIQIQPAERRIICR